MRGVCKEDKKRFPVKGGRSTGSDSIAVKVKTRKHKDVFHNFESRDSNSATSRLVEKVVNTRLVRELKLIFPIDRSMVSGVLS